jgi:hypothetical protein
MRMILFLSSGSAAIIVWKFSSPSDRRCSLQSKLILCLSKGLSTLLSWQITILRTTTTYSAGSYHFPCGLKTLRPFHSSPLWKRQQVMSVLRRQTTHPCLRHETSSFFSLTNAMCFSHSRADERRCGLGGRIGVESEEKKGLKRTKEDFSSGNAPRDAKESHLSVARAARFLFAGSADHATAVRGGEIGLSESHRGTQGCDPARQYVTSVDGTCLSG